MYLVLFIQGWSIIFYLIYFLSILFKNKLELSKYEKIDKNDKEKFLYYRDILKEFSIGELAYLFNGKKGYKLSIIAELEWLKLKGCININKDTINILKKDNLYESERYILEHYKFIKDKQFYNNYINNIKNTLIKKGCLQKHKFQLNLKLIVNFFLFIITFFVGLFLALNNDSNLLFFKIEMIFFALTWIITLVSILIFNKEMAIIKTENGKNIFLKLNGLKKYIKDFGNFEDKLLKEAILWEEYILYAIILNESKILVNQACDEYNKLINIIYK